MSKKETHLEALNRLDLNIGDLVRLTGKTNSYSRGWYGQWISGLTDFIGYVGKVKRVYKDTIVVDFGIYETYLNLDNYVFDVPAFLLEKYDVDEDISVPKNNKNIKKGKYYILTENDLGELSLSKKYFETLESAKKEVEDGYWENDKYTIIKKIATFKSETKTSWIE